MGIKTIEMEIAVSSFLGRRRNVIIPNISWGLGIHECDLLSITKSKYCTEVEIKISLSDLKKDVSKIHGHYSNKIKYLYFAIPQKLEKHIEYIPERAGVLTVERTDQLNYYRVREIRKPLSTKNCVPLSDDEFKQALRLGCLRIWGLKEKIVRLSNY